MGFCFRRSSRVLPGIRLHFGKRGVSTSIGFRGAHVTVDHGQVRETVDLPGTGLSYTHVEGTRKTAVKPAGQVQPAMDAEPLPRGRAWRGWLWAGLAIAIVTWPVWPAR
ncbi:MAG TPA: DUF4236 domain-containing protein [Steroidobacteraceae bacterium]|nr:DUF4236 domain-containing protein [Steroidobacteraceae bacterium]